MREIQRIEALQAGAEYILALPDSLTKVERDRLTTLAHDIQKAVQFVLDRDAGPSADLKGENTELQKNLETYQRVGGETVTRLDNAVKAGGELLRENRELRELLASKIQAITDATPEASREAIAARIEKAVALLSKDPPNVADAAGIVTDMSEVEKLHKQE